MHMTRAANEAIKDKGDPTATTTTTIFILGFVVNEIDCSVSVKGNKYFIVAKWRPVSGVGQTNVH